MKKIILPTLLFLMALSACNKQNKNTYALIETEQGNIKVLLYDDTPLHQANFVKLANEGFYDDLLFHRIIKGQKKNLLALNFILFMAIQSKMRS